MAIEVKLQVFEGPLDLLLYLIDKNKVNIYDIPIVLITDQYMEYVNAMDKEDLDVVSEFLLMASTLLDIKAKMLLPRNEEEETEEEDPRTELVNKLLEYKMYKYMSFELRDRYSVDNLSLYKKPTIPEEVAAYRPPVDVCELVGDTDLVRLNEIFNEVMKRQENKVDKVRSNFGKIEKEEVSLEEKIVYVKEFVLEKRVCSFRQLLMKGHSKLQIVVTFLAILELIKSSVITVTQEKTFDDIIITTI